MAEIKQKYIFSYKEVVESLIKQQGLHEGIWSLHVEFALAAANIKNPEDQLVPAAIVPVAKIGLVKTEKLNDLSVDAAVVNPQTTGNR